jgi:hypothetical protein
MLNKIDNNIKKYNNVLNSKLNKSIKQSLYLVISENYIKTYINNNNIDYIIKNINSSDIINLFIPLYDKLKDKIMKEYNINKKKKYLNIFNISNIKYIIKIDNNIKDPILNIAFKYNITSPFLPHSLEIFSHTNLTFNYWTMGKRSLVLAWVLPLRALAPSSLPLRMTQVRRTSSPFQTPFTCQVSRECCLHLSIGLKRPGIVSRSGTKHGWPRMTIVLSSNGTNGSSSRLYPSIHPPTLLSSAQLQVPSPTEPTLLSLKPSGLALHIFGASRSSSSLGSLLSPLMMTNS